MARPVSLSSKDERLKKKPIRLTLSQQARERIENDLLSDGTLASSVSDLLEQIGLGKISVTKVVSNSQPDLNQFSIYRRLVVLTKEPAAVFRSTVAFVLRVSRQLGLDDSQEAILDIVKQGVCVAFEEG